MRNTLIILTLLISTLLSLNNSMEIWKDKNYNFLDYDEMSNNLDEKCVDNEMCQNNFEDLIKKKSTDIDDAPFMTDSNGRKTTRLVEAHYHSINPLPCSCGIEFRVLDLGHQYYPRYLHTGVCKSNVCGGTYRCMERHYKIRVLKQREPRSPEIKTSLSLPDNLKGIWQPELITVTVACECSE